MAQIGRESPNARLVPEMSICQGIARIDLAAIGQQLGGYEIKGARDDLSRLPSQAAAYGQVFDRLTLVASDRHLDEAARALPAWWGLALVRSEGRTIETIRPAASNPNRDPHALVRLLWHDEALDVLEGHIGRQPRSTRRELWGRLVDLTPPEELGELVCRSLRERASWRVVG